MVTTESSSNHAYLTSIVHVWVALAFWKEIQPHDVTLFKFYLLLLNAHLRPHQSQSVVYKFFLGHHTQYKIPESEAINSQQQTKQTHKNISNNNNP